jgi:surface polysaccharide O-acyltransferase-like enzyme
MHDSDKRQYFWDNVRMLSVLAVVVLHAAMAYAPIIPWWYVNEQAKNAVLDLVLLATDGFVMPTLFFIAGYFALSSLQRRGAAGFLRAKFKRLGLPLVVVTIFFCPIISYVVYQGQGGTETYPHYWFRLLPTVLNWKLYIFRPGNVAQFSEYLWAFHLWFLAMLLVFCGLLALLHGIFSGKAGGDRVGPGYGVFLLLALAVGVAEAVGQTLVADTAWFSFGAFLEFQPARVPLYLGMFGLGTYARHRHWFSAHRIPGRLWLWGVLALAAYAAVLALLVAGKTPDPKPLWIPCAYGLSRTLVAIAVTGFLVAFGQRYWNGPGRVSASLAASSYDIYLGHLPLVVVLQYLLVSVSVSAVVKFTIVFVASVLVCWGGSRLADRHRRALVPAGILVVFGTCLLTWG